MVKFAHLADCHLGGWRDDKLRVLGLQAFSRTVDKIIEEKCDFLIIAGDFFNTAMPHIDVLKHATKELARLKNNDIPVYFISGSHDYSPSGRSMLHVLENANLMIDVQKARMEDDSLILEFTTDPKTGIKLAGLPGKKGALEREYYERLDYDLARDEPGIKIFLFHMLLQEFNLNNNISDVPMSILPEGFSYYAGGHPHIVQTKNYGKGIISYSGPLFPNNFEELERLSDGGFYIVSVSEDGRMKPEWISVMEKKVQKIRYDVKNENPEDISIRIIDLIMKTDLDDKIFLLRVAGEVDGRISDILWDKIISMVHGRGVYAYARNIYSLKSRDKDTIDSEIYDESVSDDEMIEKYLDNNSSISKGNVKMLFSILSQEKRDGETKNDFSSRINSEVSKALNLPDYLNG